MVKVSEFYGLEEFMFVSCMIKEIGAKRKSRMNGFTEYP
jgi:hypothetical protein